MSLSCVSMCLFICLSLGLLYVGAQYCPCQGNICLGLGKTGEAILASRLAFEERMQLGKTTYVASVDLGCP